MNYGSLGKYFTAVAAKDLTAVDVDPTRSNGHEFNGVASLRGVLGEVDRRRMRVPFIYVDDDSGATGVEGVLSWYDSRRGNPNRSAEWRMYYCDNEVVARASVGDRLYIGADDCGNPTVVIADGESTAAAQLDWLFGIVQSPSGFSVKNTSHREIDMLAAEVLEALGFEMPVPDDSERLLSDMLERFPDELPAASEVSAYARSTLRDVDDMIDDPDEMLVACYNRETMLFKAYEKTKAESEFARVLENGVDVDGILEVSMSVFQRRKSRAGKALENHAAYIFDRLGLKYDSQVITEKGSKPDFVFPSLSAYKDNTVPVSLLTMLGAKTTCKDRWRQVLDEAERIETKHLLTLEPSISIKTTDAMSSKNLRLVIPKPIHETYKPAQKGWLICLAEFCNTIAERQAAFSVRAS